MDGFARWHLKQPLQRAATIFVIADQLDDDCFRDWLAELLFASPHITVACHGLNHRSWSAWGEDEKGFTTALRIAKQKIKEFSGPAWRTWFRAP
ncbi:MAG: hypothetical protein NZ802_06880, partial [Candidatus Poseidoniales archaeon]|nr:hypothetical protein [Candidatus Poseidoniales archaeon]